MAVCVVNRRQWHVEYSRRVLSADEVLCIPVMTFHNTDRYGNSSSSYLSNHIEESCYICSFLSGLFIQRIINSVLTALIYVFLYKISHLFNI